MRKNEEELIMVLFAVISFAVLMLLIYGIAALAVGGTAFLVLFSDVIVCGFLIWLIVKFILKKTKKK